MELSESLEFSSRSWGKKSLNPWVKVILFTTALFLFGIILLFLLWLREKPLSPLSVYVPDLKNKLTVNIALPVNLDLSTAKELPSLPLAPRYLVYNLDTFKVYYASGAAEKIAPASFTKLLSAQVALDIGFPDQILTATKTSVDRVPTILGLRIGEQITLSDLVRAAIATSANDAASTLAESVATQNGLGYSDFVALMNQKAALLTMNQSHFTNPDGLDDTTQFTSLIDLSKLVDNTLNKYPLIMAAAASDRKDIEKSATHDRYYLPNWNGLLGFYPGVFGLKIAYTENAGYSTIVLAERNGVRVAVILSGSSTLLNRDLSAATLLDAAFTLEKITPAHIDKAAFNRHYKVWNDLAKQIRQELAASGAKAL